MKKLTLMLGILMIAGATYAHDGKGCCKGHSGSCCKKEAKAGAAKKAPATASTASAAKK